MKRRFTGIVAALALSALAAGIPQAAPAGAAAMGNTLYGGADLMSIGSSKVTGAAAIMPVKGGLKVVVSVSGLAPKSIHADHIHAGICNSNGPIKYPLGNLVADAKGQATSVTVIKAMSVAARGWYVNVHDSKTFKPIACGDVYRPDMVVKLAPTPGNMVQGLGLILGNMNPLGMMAKSYKNTVVITYVTGLGAGTTHPEHLHGGACGSNGAIKFPLANLVANPQGMALAATFIKGGIPMSGLYLNVHAPNFAVQACGNLGGTSSGM